VKDHVAKVAAAESRRLSLPQAPAEYKIALPKEWKAPTGIDFKLDEADPLYAQARDFAHEVGMSQEQFERGIAMIASREVGTELERTTAQTNELKKLGPNATARVSALLTWMDARGLGDLQPTLMTTKIVEAFEKHVQDLEGGTFSSQHREPGGDAKEIPGFETMTFEQRREAQDRARAGNSRH